MNRGKLNYLRLVVVVLLFILGCALAMSKDDAKSIVRAVLESNWPTVGIWLLAIIGAGAEKFFCDTTRNGMGGVVYQSFGSYADVVFMAATNGFSGSTSIALLKGLYLQMFFGGTFFSGFGDFDLASIFLISSFLLYYSVVCTARQIINVVFQAEATEVTSA